MIQSNPGQCDGQSGYGVTTLDAVVESIVCMKFEEILECSKSNLLEEMRRKDLDAAKKEATRWKEEVQTKVDEQDPQKVGRCTSNAGIVVLDKTAGETISIVPKNAAHAILRC